MSRRLTACHCIVGDGKSRLPDRTPVCASWFDYDTVHDIEKQACPGIFAKISNAQDPEEEEEVRSRLA